MSKVNKQVKGNNGKPVKPVVEDSDDSDSPIVQPKKGVQAVKKPVVQDSDDSDTPVVPAKTAQKGKVPAQQAKKPVAQDSDDSDDEVPVISKKPAQKQQPAKKVSVDNTKKPVQAKKPVVEDSDDESEEVVPVKKTQPAKKVSVDNTKKAVQAKKPVAQDSDSESEEVVPVKKTQPAKKVSVDNTKKAVQAKKPVAQDSDSESEEVVPVKKTQPAKKGSVDNTKKAVQAKKPVAQDSDDDSEEEVPAKKPVQQKPAQQAPQQQAPQQKQAGGNGQTYEVIVKGLSFDADEQIIGEFFTTFGEVDSVNLLKNFDGRPKGIAFVRFETEEGQQKAAAEANGVQHMGRQIWVEAAAQRGARPPRDNAGQQGQVTDESTTIFVGNLSFKADEHSLANFFRQCGNVVTTRIAKGEDGRSRGFGHVEFGGREEVEKALKLAGTEMDGRQIKVDVAAPRQGGGGDRRGGFGGGDRRGGSSGGFGGPRRGGPMGGGRGGVSLSENDKAAKKGSIVAFQGTKIKL